MLIDMTHTITPEIPIYPGTPVPSLSPACTLTRDGFRETMLSFSSHTGTHMDAPAHLLQDGRTLDDMPMSQFSGRATVLDVSGEGPVITEAFLQSRPTMRPSTARTSSCSTPAGRAAGGRRASWRTPSPSPTRRRPGIWSPGG